MALFSTTKPVRVLGSTTFGPQMTLEEVQAAFTGGLNNPAIRAIGQICLAMREGGVGDSAGALSQEKPMESAIHAGAANACAELAQILANLSTGKTGDQIKEWFQQ